jgi:hypothetical protein
MLRESFLLLIILIINKNLSGPVQAFSSANDPCLAPAPSISSAFKYVRVSSDGTSYEIRSPSGAKRLLEILFPL